MFTFRYILPLLILCSATLLQSCFTGIESTPPITDREVERVTPPPSPDDTYLSSVRPTPVNRLTPGAQWIVADSRISRIFGPEAYGKIFQPGDTLQFQAIRPAATVDGREVTDILFTVTLADTLYYRLNRTRASVTADSALTVPFAVEASLIRQASSLLEGRQFWLLTSSRFDRRNQPCTGRKYIPVTVDSVTYGNDYYPISITLRDDRGEQFRQYLSLDGPATLPRRFSSLLSLSDPRRQYPEISDATWQHIVNGTVAPGMTTAECRLSLGRPTDVVWQPGYSTLVEVWTYPGGKYLIFEDGLLTTIR